MQCRHMYNTVQAYVQYSAGICTIQCRHMCKSVQACMCKQCRYMCNAVQAYVQYSAALTEKSHAFHMQIMRGTHVTYMCVLTKIAHYFHMYNTDIYTQKPCCHTGMQITNVSSHAKHIQSTQKTHGNCGRKSCEKNYKNLVTCKAHVTTW